MASGQPRGAVWTSGNLAVASAAPPPPPPVGGGGDTVASRLSNSVTVDGGQHCRRCAWQAALSADTRMGHRRCRVESRTSSSTPLLVSDPLVISGWLHSTFVKLPQRIVKGYCIDADSLIIKQPSFAQYTLHSKFICTFVLFFTVATYWSHLLVATPNLAGVVA